MRSEPIVTGLAVLFLVLAAVPLTTAGGSEPQAATVDVLFDLGDGRWDWSVAIFNASSPTVHDITVDAASGGRHALIWSLDGQSLRGVDGVETTATGNPFWRLLLWNATLSAWATSDPSRRLAAGDAIAWQLVTWGDPAPTPTPVTREPWTSFRGGRSPGGSAPAGPSAGATVWAANLSAGPVDATPVVADGRAFFVTGGVYDWGDMGWVRGPAVVALDAASGKELWRRPFDGRQGFEILTPAYGGGALYVATSMGHLIALNATDGDVRWERSAMGNGSVAGSVIPGGSILAGALSGLASLKGADGDERWSVNLQGQTYMAQPTVSDGRVFIGTENGTLHAIDLFDGEPLWTATLGGRVRGTVLVDGSRLYATSARYVGFSAIDGTLHCLDIGGKRLWNASMPPTGSSPARLGDLVVVGSSAGLHAFTLGGKPAWSYTAAGPVSSSPAVAGGHCYFVTNVNNATAGLFSSLVAVDERGQRAWARTLVPHDWALASVAISDGRAYVASDSGWAYCLGDVRLAANFTSEVSGGRVTLTDTTDQSPAAILNWTWDLGDGSTAKGPSVVHSYRRTGPYDVTLTVVDEFGRSVNATRKVQVEVHEDGSGGFIPGCGPEIVLLTVAGAALISRRRHVARGSGGP